VRAVSVPVIAAGGIMNGGAIRAVLQLGAAGASLGTAFLVCPEAGIPEAYRQAILSAQDDSTQITTAFSGRPARGIRNRFLLAGEAHRDAILPYPWQNGLTRSMRASAAKAGNPEMLSLWAGQAAGMARPMPAAQLVRTLAEEAHL
jgi:nitronate monooxygenase